MIGIDLPDHDTAEALEQACFERGLLVLTCGERSRPPGAAARRHHRAGRHGASAILADAARVARLRRSRDDDAALDHDQLADRVDAILAACGAAAPRRRPRRPHADHRRLARRRPASPATSTPPSSAPPTRSPTWRTTPAPVRGNLVRRLGELLREHKDELGELVSIEAGKIRSEGLGEVQEMIDICDFAVGLSRQLHGLTIASERPGHRLMETWHPMGPCAVITRVQLPGRGVVVERRAGARVPATR